MDRFFLVFLKPLGFDESKLVLTSSRRLCLSLSVCGRETLVELVDNTHDLSQQEKIVLQLS